MTTPEDDAAVPGMAAGAAAANACWGGANVGAGSAWGAASFIAAAKGDPNGIPGAVAGMPVGAEAFSWDFGVNRPVMDACGAAGAAGAAPKAAGVKGEGAEAGAAAENGDAACCGMPKGDPLAAALPPREKGEAGDAPGFCCGGDAGESIANGLAAGASAAGLTENGDGGGVRAGSGEAKPGDAAAKGLIGNA